MIEEIKKDIYRRTGTYKLSFWKYQKLKRLPQIKIVIRKRKIDYYRNRSNILCTYHKVVIARYKTKYGVDLPARLNLGNGFIIEHINGIVINPLVSIGDNCNIYNGVTIGLEKRGKRKGVPTIENEVWIGANACIVGKINIGNNVLIAPGAYVNFDVPDNSIVVGNPGKVIHNDRATEVYISNLV